MTNLLLAIFAGMVIGGLMSAVTSIDDLEDEMQVNWPWMIGGLVSLFVGAMGFIALKPGMWL